MCVYSKSLYLSDSFRIERLDFKDPRSTRDLRSRNFEIRRLKYSRIGKEIARNPEITRVKALIRRSADSKKFEDSKFHRNPR